MLSRRLIINGEDQEDNTTIDEVNIFDCVLLYSALEFIAAYLGAHAQARYTE